MAESGPWRGDAVRRGLAAELGVNVADYLQGLADDVLEKIEADEVTFDSPRDRNNALAFVALCLGGNMREEPEAVERRQQEERRQEEIKEAADRHLPGAGELL